MALLCLLVIMIGLCITMWIGLDAMPKWKAQYTSHFDNGAWASPIRLTYILPARARPHI